MKRRRSTVSQVLVGGPTPRFSAESQATDGDFEKQSNIFDNVSAAPTRNHAEPVLPPASPDIEGEPVEPYQPNFAGSQPSQYDPYPTLNVASILTSPPQSYYSWTGEEGIDDHGSPALLPQIKSELYATNLSSMTASSTGTQRSREAWI